MIDWVVSGVSMTFILTSLLLIKSATVQLLTFTVKAKLIVHEG
ncbi:hypothetical protein LDG_7783 [Legionella drancourtii LLAP12]|uniref:Uncharacterized protein n=1 Tax=Legionella drancourtii LLAP12 TaxID=658187 RepID=G9ER72_9GAMM|nr:hypothetical protein LDG_7783 [Legionella drancourtii LLAP12]